jgi:hypothetical protein
VWVVAKAVKTIEKNEYAIRYKALSITERDAMQHLNDELKELVDRANYGLVAGSVHEPLLYQVWQMSNRDEATADDVIEMVSVDSTIDLLTMIAQLQFELDLARQTSLSFCRQIATIRENGFD